jgi:hypothetical protein
MRPWMIVLSSVLGGLGTAATWAWPQLREVSRSDVVPHLLPHLPVLAVTTLAVYALGALVLSTGTLVASALRVRHRLGRTEPHQVPSPRNWTTAFGSTELERLVPRFTSASTEPVRLGGIIVLQSRFNPAEARGEIARLYYLWLARTHFVSALVVLAAVVVLGLARDRGSIVLPPSEIPTIATVLIVVGLILLALLGRIAIDVTIEPLLEMIVQIPAEPAEVGLLRRVADVLEATSAPPRPIASETAGSAPLSERLAAAIESGHRALLDAIGRLSTTTAELEATMRSSLEAVETATRVAAAHSSPLAERGNADAVRLSELQAAIESLTALLERLTRLPEAVEEMPHDPVPVTRHRGSETRLAGELRSLLQEIGSA